MYACKHSPVIPEYNMSLPEHHHLVDVGRFWSSVGNWSFTVFRGGGGLVHDRIGSIGWNTFVDVHLAGLNSSTNFTQPIWPQGLMLEDWLVVFIDSHTSNNILGVVRISLQNRGVLSKNLTSTKPSVNGGLVQNQGIFDIVTRVGHDGDSGILTSWKFVVIDQFDGLGLDHWLLRINHQVQQRVDSLELVVGDCTDGLLTHRTLIRVTWRLVVMWVWNQTGNGTEHCEWFDFQMGDVDGQVGFVKSDETIVLFVDIQVLDKTLLQEVVELQLTLLQLQQMVRFDLGFPLGDNDQRTTNTATVCGDMDSLLMQVGVDGDEFGDFTGTSQRSELRDKLGWETGGTNDSTVQSFLIGSSSSSVVMCVIKAKFLTKPQASPSGVSEVHNIPNWEGYNLDKTWVTPALSILNLFKDQLPVEMALFKPEVILLEWMLMDSNGLNSVALFGFLKILSMFALKSVLNFLNKSSNSKDINCPANSNLLLPT
ncbi:hypothetical protein WICPIJ_008181 [Wickerhamomyces pijperi]|uniref:Uncharacterized protein n=1 Tax=Wickerhamomyces pijperi TaxID=599730 RepID=A0A9P8Q0P3_WICPI|nr:hypothetical protein WICPIJ_008181 [Wickerhamomyces pijperi]